MPELPEVEITTRKLRALILGKRILPAGRQVLGGRKIVGVERRGKAILIYLSGKRLLAFHQRMTGKLLIVPRNYQNRHIRRRFRLSSGKDLVMHDVRKFGVIWYGASKQILKDNYFKTLGEDALMISLQNFINIFKNRSGRIKPFLLKQDKIAGIGNIIADEVLWKAKIGPETKIANLTTSQVVNLYKALKFILRKSIKLGGSTMRDWLHPEGKAGGYFEKRFVYDREGKKCFRCRSRILRKKIGSRSAYFCPQCQKV